MRPRTKTYLTELLSLLVFDIYTLFDLVVQCRGLRCCSGVLEGRTVAYSYTMVWSRQCQLERELET